MENKNVEEETKPVDKSVISSTEVDEAVHGDEEALAEQMERIKNLTKEQQLVAIEEMKRKAAEKILNDAREKQENEKKLAQRQLQEEAKRVAAKKIAEQQALANKLATEEQEKQKQNAIIEAKKQEELEKQRVLAEQKKQEELEKKKAEEQNNKGGPSTFKRVLAIILFLAFGSIIYFLSDITKLINEYKASKAPKEVITTGVSICTLSKSDVNLDIDITATFSIVNSKLYKLTYTTVTKGDKEEDKQELSKLNEKCLKLKKEAGELSGVSIICNLNNGINNSKQILDYEKLDASKVTSAYTEAGGIYPEFRKNESIDKIESNMTKSGYTCSRN